MHCEVTLIGNLGRDPEVKTSNAGTAWATLSVATTRRAKGLVYAPTMHVLDDEILEAKHQVSEWSKHLRALEAYARTVAR